MALEKPKSLDNGENPKHHSRLGKLARRLFGHEQEKPEVEPKKVTLKVRNSTQVGELYKSTRESKVDGSVLHPALGQVAIISRPEEMGVSYVFQVVELAGNRGAVWTCHRVTPKLGIEGEYTCSRLKSPMDGFSMAIDAQSKDEDFMPQVHLPKGTELLITRAAEIPELQQVVESSKNSSQLRGVQQRYQTIINEVTAIRIDQ